MRLVAAVVLVVSLPTSSALADPFDPIEDQVCFAEGPDLSSCAAWAAVPNKTARLRAILCVAERINEWKYKQIACIERLIQRRRALVLFPPSGRGGLGAFMKSLATLRTEVERLACGWRFSRRTRLLEDLYLRKFQFCRESRETLFGSHRRYFDAPLQELMDWSAVSSFNLVGERTGGPMDHGPEATWQYTATSVATQHVEKAPDVATAMRFAATVAADRLRAQNSTLQMQAQRMLVEQQGRELMRLERYRERALGLYLLEQLRAPVGAEE